MPIETAVYYILEDMRFHEMTETEPKLAQAEQIALNSFELWGLVVHILQCDKEHSKDGKIDKTFLLDVIRFGLQSLHEKKGGIF